MLHAAAQSSIVLLLLLTTVRTVEVDRNDDHFYYASHLTSTTIGFMIEDETNLSLKFRIVKRESGGDRKDPRNNRSHRHKLYLVTLCQCWQKDWYCTCLLCGRVSQPMKDVRRTYYFSPSLHASPFIMTNCLNEYVHVITLISRKKTKTKGRRQTTNGKIHHGLGATTSSSSYHILQIYMFYGRY